MSIGYLSGVENYQKEIENYQDKIVKEVEGLKSFCKANILNGTVQEKVDIFFKEFLESRSKDLSIENIELIILEDKNSKDKNFKNENFKAKNFKVIKFDKAFLVLRDNLLEILEGLSKDDNLELQKKYQNEEGSKYLFGDIFKLAHLKINRDEWLSQIQSNDNFDPKYVVADVGICVTSYYLTYPEKLVERFKNNKISPLLRGTLSEGYLSYHLYKEAFATVEAIKDKTLRILIHFNNMKALVERDDIKGLWDYSEGLTDLNLRAVACGYLNKMQGIEKFSKELDERITVLKIDVVKKCPKKLDPKVALSYIEKVLENPLYISIEKIDLDEESDINE